MRIAIISPGPFTVPPINGSSVELDIDEVSRELARDHSVDIYTRKGGKYKNSEHVGNIHYIRYTYKGGKEYIRQVAKDLKKRNVDVILIENRPSYVSAVKKRLPNTPIVLNMHSHVYAVPPIMSREKMRKVGKQVNALITNSYYLRGYLIREFHIDPSKVHAVHLGVHLEPYVRAAFSSEVQQLRRKYKLEPTDRVLFFAGRLMKEKGVHLLVKSFREIAKQDPRARLMVVGATGYGSNRNNAYVRYLHKIAKPVKDKVLFTNFVSSNKMPIYYQLADIVATPSVWKEAFCRVNLEAMASGKPVLSTTSGGISEVIMDNQTGILIHPSRWVRECPEWWNLLWSRRFMREEMGRKALIRAAQFNWQATAQGYLDVFFSCMDKD